MFLRQLINVRPLNGTDTSHLRGGGGTWRKKKQGEKEARFASPKGSLDHLLRQVMGLDGLIEARFSSMAAAPHRVPSSGAHCSIKGSFRGESKFYLHLCRAHPNVR